MGFDKLSEEQKKFLLKYLPKYFTSKGVKEGKKHDDADALGVELTGLLDDCDKLAKDIKVLGARAVVAELSQRVIDLVSSIKKASNLTEAKKELAAAKETLAGIRADYTLLLRQTNDAERLSGAQKPDVAKNREKTRKVAAEEEISSLDEAITAMQGRAAAKLLELRGELNHEERDKIEQAYEAIKAEEAEIAQRKAQLEAYAAKSDKRIEDLEKLEQARQIGEATAKQLKAGKLPDNLKDIKGAGNSDKQFNTSAEVLLKLEAAQRQSVIEASLRLIRMDRMFLGEEDMTELSSAERDTLLSLLDGVRHMGTKAPPDPVAGAKALEYVKKLQTAFITTRSAALPVFDPPRLEDGVAIRNRLDALELPILDIRTLDAVQGKALSDRWTARIADISDLRVRAVKRIDRAKGRSDELKKAAERETELWGRLRDEVTKLENDVSNAYKTLTAPPKKPGKSQEIAANVARIVDGKLASLYRTEEIKDTGKILAPGMEPPVGADPKDYIPASQVLEVVGPDGKVKMVRIDTRTEKGVEVDRRADKHVPREMIDLLHARSEALKLMAQMGSDEAEIARYAKETDALVTEVTSKEGKENYDAVMKIINEIDKLMTHKTISTYEVAGYPALVDQWTKFKEDYGRMAPGAAATMAKKFQSDFNQKNKEAHDLKDRHDGLLAQAGNINLDISAVFDKAGMGDGSDIGSEVAWLFEGGAQQLLKSVANPDPKLVKMIEDACSKMKTQVANKTAEFDSCEGPWRQNLGTAWRILQAKSTAAVDQAKPLLDKIDQELTEFRRNLDKVGGGGRKLDPKALQALAEKMKAMADGAEAAAKLKKEWEAERARFKKAFEQLDKMSLDKLNNGQALEARFKGMKTQYESIKSQLEEKVSVEDSRDQLKSLADQAESMLDEANGSPKRESRVAKKIDVERAANTAKERLAFLGTRADGIVEELRGKLTDIPDPAPQDWQGPSRKDLTVQVDAVADLFKTLGSLPAAAQADTLVSLCTKLSQTVKDEKTSRDARLAAREAALAALNQTRRIFNAHPAIKALRLYPGKGATAFQSASAALHGAEVAILASYDPRS